MSPKISNIPFSLTLSYRDPDQIVKEQERKALELPEVDYGSENSLSEKTIKLNGLASEMANIGQRVQSQLTSLHETVFKETEMSKENSKKWDPFPPELIARLHHSTTDVNCEVQVLERYLDQVRELITIGGKNNNGLHTFKGVFYEENNNETDENKKKLSKEVELMRGHLQINGGILDHEGLVRRLESDRSKLEVESYNYKQKLKLIKDKLNERGQLDEELDLLTKVECKPDEENEDGFALSELVTLRKERKVLLATVHKLQKKTTNGYKMHKDTADAAVQCKMNVLGQLGNHGVSLSSVEVEELKTSLLTLQLEHEKLEEKYKSMEEESGKLTEEKRALEDSVNKLRSQITDALDSSLEEMEQLHHQKEELNGKIQLLEAENKNLRENVVELSTKNATHLKALLDEIERKDSLEDAVDYLGTEIQKLNEINSSMVYCAESETRVPRETGEKIHNSGLLSEIKTCKELIDSQTAQIRQLQVDKRDIEDSFINLKREIVVLKTKRGDRRQLDFESVDKESDGSMQPARKSSVERCEFLKQDILRLTKRGTELENVIKALKSDNSNLEEEKVCLLDSLYHQLEKNEKLEVQINKLKSIISENDITIGLDPVTTNHLPNSKQQSDASSDEETDFNGNVVATENITQVSPERDEHSSSSDESLRMKSVQLSDDLKGVKERLLEIEKENERIKQELQESRRSETELREMVSTMKKEATVSKHQFQKNQEVTNTLQECLREAHEEKQELVESLDEVTEEKAALEKKVETMDKELTSLKENYQPVNGELEPTTAGMESAEKAKQQMRSIYAKLWELYESLTDKDKDSSSEETATDIKEMSLEEQGNNILSLVEKVQQEVTLLKKELRRVKTDQENLKVKLESSQTEKLSLQKYVRELDEKRRQVKSFITKLTEEKEAMSEQIDEIKQQKNNLADALENVYQSKEGLQYQLEDALCKQHESTMSLTEVSAEVQSLKKSLSRMVEERDALKEALLETTTELHTLKESEAKWKEKVTGAQVEADQSVEDTKDANKEEEKDVITRLHLDNDGLKKQLEELMSTKRSTPGETAAEKEAPVRSSSNPETDLSENHSQGENGIQPSTALQCESSPPVYEMVTRFDNREFEQPPSNENDLIAPSEASSTLENPPPSDQLESLDVRYNKVCAEKKLLEEDLKRSVEEIEQLKGRFDSISSEKENVEKQQELMIKENKEMLSELEKAKEEEARLKLRIEETSKQREQLAEEKNNLEKKYSEMAEEKERTAWESETRTIEVARLLEQMESLEEQLQGKSYELAEMENNLKHVTKEKEDLDGLVNEMQKEKEDLEAKLEKHINEYKAFQETLAESETQKTVQDEELKKSKQELQDTTKKLRDEIETLTGTLKGVQGKLATAEDDLELAEEEKDKLLVQVTQFEENEKLLGDQMAAKSREISDLKEKVEKLDGDKQFLTNKLEETKIESNSMRDQLKELRDQALDLHALIDESVVKKSAQQSEGTQQGEANLQYVYQYIVAVLEEKGSVEAKLEEAENSSREIQDDNKQLLQERTELTIQLHEALGKEDVDEPSTPTTTRYDETRLSREISDVRSLIEKLSLQKEKLGAALAHKESQIAAVTAEAVEKTKMLENKEKEAESLSLTQAEVTVALEHATKASDELLAELECEKENVSRLTQELENAKNQSSDLGVALAEAKSSSDKLLSELEREKNTVASLSQELEHATSEEKEHTLCINRLEEEKKAFMMALNKSRELEKRLNKAQEENIKIREQNSELEANVEAQAASILSFETMNKESELRWRNDLDEKDEQLECLKEEIKKSSIAMTDLLRVVDDQKSKIAKLEKNCDEAEKSQKEAVDEVNNLQKKLDEETEGKKALDEKLKEVQEMIAKREDQNEILKQQIAGHDRERLTLEQSVKELETKNKDKAKRLLDLNCTKTFLEDECKKSTSEVTSLKEDLASKSSSLEDIQKELNRSKDFYQEGKSKYDQLKKEREDLKKSLDAAENKFRKAEATTRTTIEQNEKLTKKLEAIEKEMASLNSAFGEAQNKEQTLLNEVNTETVRIETELESLRRECDTLQKKLNETIERNGELEKELELKISVEKDLAKLTEEHKALKAFSQKLVDDKVDQEQTRKEKRELEKQLRREKSERASIEEEMERLREEHEAIKISSQNNVAQDQTDADNLLQSGNEEIIACVQGGLLSSEVEMEYGLGSAKDQEDGSVEDKLSKERELNAELHEEIEELIDQKDELNEIIDELRSKTKKLQTDVDTLIDEKESLEDKLDENEKHYKEELGSLDDANKELSKKLEVLLKDKNMLREEIKAKEQEYRKVLEERKKLEEALEKSDQEVKIRVPKKGDQGVRKGTEEKLTKSKEKVKELERKMNETRLEKQEVMNQLGNKKSENSTLRKAVEEITSAKEEAEKKLQQTEKDLYDEIDHLQKALDEKSNRVTSLEEEVMDYKRSGGTEVKLKKPKKEVEELEELRIELNEKDKKIDSLEKEFATHKQSASDREQEIHLHLDRIQQKLADKDKKIASLEEEIDGFKRTRQKEKGNIDKNKDGTTVKDHGDKLSKLQSELAEKEMRIGSLEEAIVEYKRSRFEEEKDFQMKEAHLAAAREEFYKTMKERCEDEERLESIRRANNRLQEALELAREKEKRLKKELQQATGRERSHSFVSEGRLRSSSAGNLLESGVSEFNLSPQTTVTSSSLEKARKEIAMLEEHEHELRSELRKARDQVFDLHLELSDALHALRQKERLHEQERKLFQSSIEDMEKEYNKMRKEFSSLISMEKNRSSFITVVELKGSLKKAESDMLEAIAKTAELLSRAKNDIRESRRNSISEDADRSKERTRSFIEQSTQENKELLKQLDDAWKERDRLAKRLKRSESARVILKQILNESLVEVERFKQLVDCTEKPEKRRRASTGRQKKVVNTQELETQSDLTATDLEEAQRLKDSLEDLRRNIRGLEECLSQERSKGEGNLLDFLREKNRLNAEITALKECAQESNKSKDSLHSKVHDLQEKLELAQKEKTAVELEISEVRFEADKLRNLSYDERAEKNSWKQENAELKKTLQETRGKDGKIMKESEKVKELKKDKERLSAENETLKKNVKDLKKELDKSKKDNFAAVCKELENAKHRISELSNAKEVAINKNMAIESELKATKESLKALQTEQYELKNENNSLEENCKELENERTQLVEDAHSFKVTMENKNQDLLSKIDAKEHEAISLQTRVEELSTLQRKLENDCRGLEKDKETALCRVRQLQYDKQRIETVNREQRAEIEHLLLDKGNHKELNDKLRSLFAEKDKLEELNRKLEMDVRDLYKALETKGQDVNKVVEELKDMASKVRYNN